MGTQPSLDPILDAQSSCRSPFACSQAYPPRSRRRGCYDSRRRRSRHGPLSMPSPPIRSPRTTPSFATRTKFIPPPKMTVRTDYNKATGKTYIVLSRTGSDLLQNLFSTTILENESASTCQGIARRRGLTSANYEMKLNAGEPQRFDGRDCLVLTIHPGAQRRTCSMERCGSTPKTAPSSRSRKSSQSVPTSPGPLRWSANTPTLTGSPWRRMRTPPPAAFSSGQRLSPSITAIIRFS